MLRTFLLAFLFLMAICSKGNKPVYTQVTFMYDIKRGDLGNNFKRSYEYYLGFFDKLLGSDSNLIIFGGKALQEYVWKRRKVENTVFVLKEQETFKQLWYYKYVERLRQQRQANPSFPYKHYPQFALEYYNPLIMSKLYMLTFALDHDKFNSDFFIWNDGGYMHQFPRNIFESQNLVRKFFQLVQPQWIFFTYNDGNMFLGYNGGSEKYLKRRVEAHEAVLASNFGGYIEILRDVKSTYQNFLRITLENGDMNSDQSVFSMMPIKFPYLIPSTFGLYLNDLYQKFTICEDINRKPEHSRYFRGSFDKDDNFAVTQNKILTKYNFKQKLIEVEPPKIEPKNEVATTQIKSQTIIDRNSSTALTPSNQIERFMMLIGDKNGLYRQIFFRQLVYLITMVIAYIILLVKRAKAPRRRQERFYDENASDRSHIVIIGSRM